MLNERELTLLRRIVWSRQPGLQKLTQEIGSAPLREEEREELRGLLAEELTENGLRPDGEPNEHGLEVDRLIGRLGDF